MFKKIQRNRLQTLKFKIVLTFMLVILSPHPSIAGGSLINDLNNNDPRFTHILSLPPLEKPHLTGKAQGLYEELMSQRNVKIEGETCSFCPSYLVFESSLSHLALRYSRQTPSGSIPEMGILVLEKNQIGFRRKEDFIPLVAPQGSFNDDDLYKWFYANKLVRAGEYDQAKGIYTCLKNSTQLGSSLLEDAKTWLLFLDDPN